MFKKSNHCLECKAGSGSPLYLMMQKRYETEVTKLSQNSPSFFAVIYKPTSYPYFSRLGYITNGVGQFSGERVLENTPTPLFVQPLKFIAHGRVFKSLWYVHKRIKYAKRQALNQYSVHF